MSDKADVKPGALNDWFITLDDGRRRALLDDKWMLADAAYHAGADAMQATIAEQAREIASKQATIDGMNEKHWEVVQELATLKQPISDGREAFEAWRLANFCGGAERLKKCSNAPDVYYYAAEQEAWKVWQARARLGNAVVMPDDDEIMQMAFEIGDPCDEASGYWFSMEQWEEFITALRTRLNPSRGVPSDLLLEAIDVLMLYTRGSASREGILINGIRALLNGGRS